MLPRWLCFVGLFAALAPTAAAQESKDPLRFVPKHAEWVLKVDHPRRILDAVKKNDAFQQAQKLAVVRDYYDSTNYQRLYQLIAYFEKELGQGRDELLDELTGGGVAVAAKFSPPQGVMLVIQAKDEKKLRRFVEVGLDVLEKELQRQESKDRVTRTKHAGCDVGQLGPKLFFAIADGALVVATEGNVIKAALDVGLKKEQGSILTVPNFVEARKSAAKPALAWTWFHLEEIRKIPAFKAGLDAASLDVAQSLLFGGLADMLKRTPYVAGALTQKDGGYRLGISMPRGRQGMAALAHMLMPADGNGTLPPLAPPRTLASASYFIDLGEYFEKRAEILGEKNAKGLEEAERNLAKVLGGLKLGKLLKDMGPHHRLVFAQQKETPYKIKPAQPFPAFALVVDMRDPAFAKNMNTILRSAALLGTFKFGLNLKETTYKDCALVSYYFSETKKVDGDTGNVRFHFSPTYVTVGDQFVASATAELARDLIDVLKTDQSKASRATMRTRLYASGLADLIRSNQDGVLTQLILSQALPPANAKQELRTILDWVDRLGTLAFQIDYGQNEFHYDIVWQAK